MYQLQDDVIDLGQASAETKGEGLVFLDSENGRQPITGLSDE
jgi:hypothetical protein